MNALKIDTPKPPNSTKTCDCDEEDDCHPCYQCGSPICFFHDLGNPFGRHLPSFRVRCPACQASPPTYEEKILLRTAVAEYCKLIFDTYEKSNSFDAMERQDLHAYIVWLLHLPIEVTLKITNNIDNYGYDPERVFNALMYLR